MVSTLYNEWFSHTKLNFSPQVEGNCIDDGRMVLGMRSGPVKDEDALLHEMGHFVEIDDARCTLPGWGLHVTTVCFPGHPPCLDPRTFQACEREIRVMGIQRVLAAHFNMDFDDFYHAKLIWDWVPGVFFMPGLPSCRDESVSRDDLYKARVERMMEMIVESSAQWTVDRIYAEWTRKCAIHDMRCETGEWS